MGVVSILSFFVFDLFFSAMIISISDLLISLVEYSSIKTIIAAKIYTLYKKFKPDDTTKVIYNGVNTSDVFELYKKYSSKRAYSNDDIKDAKKRISIWKAISSIVFSLGIAVFYVFPFFYNTDFMRNLERLGPVIPALAFSVMSSNLFIHVIIDDLSTDIKQVEKLTSSTLFQMD